MPTFTVRLFADGARSLRTQDVAAPDVAYARAWASDVVHGSQTFSHARIYEGDLFLSEIGYRINRWTDGSS